MKVESTTTQILDVTPQVLAKAFWGMSDCEQADFFDALYDEVAKTKTAYSHGEMQWCYMWGVLKKRNGKGLQMYHALSVFAFDVFQSMGLQQKYIYPQIEENV